MAPNEIELGVLRTNLNTANETSRNASNAGLDPSLQAEEGFEHEFSLPPVDGGKDAWLFLGAAFLIEVLVWGKIFLHPLIYSIT